jgi:hypothetical protein
MSHTIRKLSEFSTSEEYTFRVDSDGSLVTDELLLVEPEDMPAFIEWLTREFNTLPDKEKSA